jgi:hypothetical protein
MYRMASMTASPLLDARKLNQICAADWVRVAEDQ